MIVCLYTIYDRVAEECGPVYSAPNDGVAMRAYRQGMANVDPLDRDAYKLMYIGSMDTSTMKIDPFYPPREVDISIEGAGS